MRFVSSAYLNSRLSLDNGRRSLSITVYNIGPTPEPCTMPRLILIWFDRQPSTLTHWVRSDRNETIQLIIIILVNTQGPIRLWHACYVTVAGQRAAAASQPAGCYTPTACGRTDRFEVTAAKVYLHAFAEKCHFVTKTPIDIKPSTSPAHGRYTSACQISPSYDAAFRTR